MTAVASARAFGNDFFKKGDHRTALKKYRKSLRYLDVCWEKGELDEDRSNALRKIKSVILTNSAVSASLLASALIVMGVLVLLKRTHYIYG
jgi:peptidyl-prolyl isomerase D